MNEVFVPVIVNGGKRNIKKGYSYHYWRLNSVDGLKKTWQDTVYADIHLPAVDPRYAQDHVKRRA